MVFFLCLVPSLAKAAIDKEPWVGVGAGFAIWTKGSGAGFNIRGEGGYNFTKTIGAGLHTNYSRLGTVGVKMIDYGAFVQVQDPETSFFGRLYLDGITAIVDGDTTNSGISASETAFAPGIGTGLIIPSGGFFHMVPQVDYKVGLFTQNIVHVVQGSFNLVWDF